MGIIEDITEFGAGLRAHLELHGVRLELARAVPETADLFALFVTAAPAKARPRLRLRFA